MKYAGEISQKDWRLFVCDTETGGEQLISWGDYDDALSALRTYAENGDDVWIIGPDGKKIVWPNS